MTDLKENIARKLRATSLEYGDIIVKDSIVCSDMELGYDFGGVKQLYCPTISIPTLGNVSFKVARYFEDC